MAHFTTVGFFFQFFVAADPTVKNDRLWHDKYSLRKSMIPTFISTDQARKVSYSLTNCGMTNRCLRKSMFPTFISTDQARKASYSLTNCGMTNRCLRKSMFPTFISTVQARMVSYSLA